MTDAEANATFQSLINESVSALFPQITEITSLAREVLPLIWGKTSLAGDFFPQIRIQNNPKPIPTWNLEQVGSWNNLELWATWSLELWHLKRFGT